MSLGKERLKELYGDKHPAIGSYLECMTRASLAAVATFTVTFSCTYLSQKFLKQKLPYSTKGLVLASSVIASFLSYTVIKSKSKDCQAAWLAAEDKVTYFTQLESTTNSN